MSIRTLKRFTILTTLAALVCAARAEEVAAAKTETEEHEPPWFEAGFDNDLFTAYVWRNAVANDRPVWQPCVWGDFTRFEPFWIGFSVWQNWDLSGRRADDGLPRAMNETDYNVHVGATAWESDDEAWSLGFEVGHEWYDYRPKDGYRSDYPTSYEIYVKSTFDTPFVGLYGQYSQAYDPVSACHFEVGLNKEINLGETFGREESILKDFTFGADWNVNFGSGKYLTEYLYCVGRGDYDDNEEAFEEDCLKNGIGGTTLKFTLGYAVCENFTLGVVAAYTAVLNQDARDGLQAAGYNSLYRNLVWGGVQAKISF